MKHSMLFQTGLYAMAIFITLGMGCNKDDKDETVKDEDGNSYKTLTIGTQVWMTENLRTTKYNDGTAIQYQPDSVGWITSVNKPVYCWYQNNESKYKTTYGALYNFWAVTSGKLCPKGWHVPSEQEWIDLEVFLGMDANEAEIWGWRGEAENIGGKMKATGTSNWKSPNAGADNSSGFNGLPGGIRDIYGKFEWVPEYGYWWTSTKVQGSTQLAWMRSLSANLTSVFKSQYPNENGFSVRCLKDK